MRVSLGKADERPLDHGPTAPAMRPEAQALRRMTRAAAASTGGAKRYPCP